jgi:type IV secretion system protein VirB1
MTAGELMALAQQCAPGVTADLMTAVVRTESSFQPYAIGVVHGRLVRPPRTLDEAAATVQALEAAGWNYSVGLGQVNRVHFPRFGFDARSAFEPCTNLRASNTILTECHNRALRAGARAGGQKGLDERAAVAAALSCYYSGNFQRGYLKDAGRSSYVQRVATNVPVPGSGPAVAPIPVIATPPSGSAKASSSSSTSSASPVSPGTEPASTPRAPWDALREF